MNIWNRLPFSAVLHVIPSVDNFHKFAIPAIRVMKPLNDAALIYIIYEGHVFFAFFTFILYAYCEQ